MARPPLAPVGYNLSAYTCAYCTRRRGATQTCEGCGAAWWFIRPQGGAERMPPHPKPAPANRIVCEARGDIGPALPKWGDGRIDNSARR